MVRTVLPLSLLVWMGLAGCDRTGSSLANGGTETTDGTGSNTGSNTPTGTTGNTGNTGNTGGAFSCSDGPTDPEQLFAEHFVSLYPNKTDVPYTFDAGVGDVLDVLSALGDGEDADLDHTIDGAVVTNVDYAPAGSSDVNFWFADASGSLRTYAASLGGFTVDDLSPGDVVSFRATSGTSYYGELEITDIEDFQIVSSGEPVYVFDGNGDFLDYDSHGRTNVSVYGEVLSLQGDCGGQDCWDIELANGQMVTLRAKIEFHVGDCIWWIGPLGIYGDDLRLALSNFDWYSIF